MKNPRGTGTILLALMISLLGVEIVRVSSQIIYVDPQNGDPCYKGVGVNQKNYSLRFNVTACRYNDPVTNDLLEYDICGGDGTTASCPPLSQSAWMSCGEITDEPEANRSCNACSPIGQSCSQDTDCCRGYIPLLVNPPLPIKIKPFCDTAAGVCRACIPNAYPCFGSKLPCCGKLANGASSTFSCKMGPWFDKDVHPIWPLCSPDLCSGETYTGFQLQKGRCGTFGDANACQCDKAGLKGYSCQAAVNLGVGAQSCKTCGVENATCDVTSTTLLHPPCCPPYKCTGGLLGVTGGQCKKKACGIQGQYCGSLANGRACCPGLVNVDGSGTPVTCHPFYNYCAGTCAGDGEQCAGERSYDCCDTLGCLYVSETSSICKPCSQSGGTCGATTPCCSGMGCFDGVCETVAFE